jgi:outer membrane immunogenic protein
LRKEIAALRERERLMTEKAGVQQRVERRSPAERPVYAAAHRAQPAGPIYASADPAPIYKAPYNPPSAYIWTGCYVGVNGGGGRSKNDWGTFAGTITMADVRSNGFFGGAQTGCDYQQGPWVFGVEGTFDWGNVNGQAEIPPQGAPAQDASKLDMFGTASGRIGYAFDRVLPYAKAGLAWAHFNHEFTVPGVAGSVSGDQSVVGFVVGGGVEVAFAPNWSFNVEYDYFDFGTNGVELSCVGACGILSTNPENIRQNVQTVMLGLNYRFAPGTLVGRF